MNQLQSDNHDTMSFLKGFYYAYCGIKHIISKERNFRIHIFMFTGTVLLGVILNLTQLEWLIIILTSGFVLVTEMINSSFEELLDHLIKEHHEGVKVIKDVCAGAVLITAVFSAAIGVIIFLPKILSLFV